jgi:hypothetical protein
MAAPLDTRPAPPPAEWDKNDVPTLSDVLREVREWYEERAGEIEGHL